MIVLALDPGVTTGIALSTATTYLVQATKDESLVWTTVWSFGHTESEDRVVLVEQFASVWNDTNRIKTIEMVGAIKALCWKTGTRLVRRTPQHRRPHLNRAVEWLKQRGERFSDHERDALAHILSWENSLAARRTA